MDRLETKYKNYSVTCSYRFIFQYGQIRNITIDDYYLKACNDLYSSMDRLETYFYLLVEEDLVKFTFQYGQIRNIEK